MPTLEELEGEVWPDPPSESPNFVLRCHALRKVPIQELQPGDLRVLLLQDLSVPHLLPIAAAVLQANPLIEGDYYPGDLLNAVMQLPHQALATSPVLSTVREAAEAARRELQASDDLLESDAELLQDVESFLGTHYV